MTLEGIRNYFNNQVQNLYPRIRENPIKLINMVGAVASSYAMCQMAYEICEETNYDIGKNKFCKAWREIRMDIFIFINTGTY